MNRSVALFAVLALAFWFAWFVALIDGNWLAAWCAAGATGGSVTLSVGSWR